MNLRSAFRFLRGFWGGRDVSNGNNDLNADFLVKSECEYYTTARFAMHAQRSFVCGNLFHHAVEMLLKAGLAKNEKKRRRGGWRRTSSASSTT